MPFYLEMSKSIINVINVSLFSYHDSIINVSLFSYMIYIYMYTMIYIYNK